MPHPTHPVLPLNASTDSEVVHADLAVLPVGSFEQHGPHMPLATDTLVAVAISNTIADRAKAAGVPVRLLPPVTIGCSHEHADFLGTVSISATTLAAIITDIAQSLAAQGVKHLVVVNGHGGNYVLANVVQEANLTRPRSMALFPNRADWTDARGAAGLATDAHEDMHAGELEGSILLAAWPDYLQPEWADAWAHDDHAAPDRRLLNTLGISAYTTSGIIGQPSQATESKGRAVLESLGENAMKMMENLTKTSTSN